MRAQVLQTPMRTKINGHSESDQPSSIDSSQVSESKLDSIDSEDLLEDCRIEFNNGFTYNGQSVPRFDGSRIREGFGTLYFPDGRIEYQGHWRNNMRHGEGIVWFEDRTRFEGDFKDDKRSGVGTLYRRDGTVSYQGQWDNDQPNGQGIFYFENGQNIRYQGEVKEGLKHGSGMDYYPNGRIKFQGQYENDERHGQGIEHLSNETIEGIWQCDKKHGECIITLWNMTKARVIYINNQLQINNCELYWQDETIMYTGQLNHDFIFHGYGSFYNRRQVMEYEGNWYLGKRQGKGIVYYQDHESYEKFQGSFQNDVEEGVGYLTYKSGRIDIVVMKNGRLAEIFEENVASRNDKQEKSEGLSFDKKEEREVKRTFTKLPTLMRAGSLASSAFSKSLKEPVASTQLIILDEEGNQQIVTKDTLEQMQADKTHRLKELEEERKAREDLEIKLIKLQEENEEKERTFLDKQEEYEYRIQELTEEKKNAIANMLNQEFMINENQDQEENKSENEEESSEGDSEEEQEEQDEEENINVNVPGNASDVDLDKEETTGKKKKKEDDFVEEEEAGKAETLPNYQKFKAWLCQLHPSTSSLEKFSIWEDVGSFPLFNISDEEGKNMVMIRQIHKQIGLGPSLLLLTTKALTSFFLLLTIINIPMFIVLVNAQGEDSNLTFSNLTPLDIFAKTSIGNLGESIPSCARSMLSDDDLFNKTQLSGIVKINHGYKDLKFECPNGKLGEPKLIGWHKDEIESSCINVVKVFQSKNITSIDEFKKTFDDWKIEGDSLKNINHEKYMKQPNCKGEEDCIFKPDIQRGNLEKIQDTSQYKYLVMVLECSATDIQMPIFGKQNKVNFGLLYVCFDIMIIILISYFESFLMIRTNEFIERFKEESIQMDDYTLQISNLPEVHDFRGDNMLLRSLLYNHFNSIFEETARIALNAESFGMKKKKAIENQDDNIENEELDMVEDKIARKKLEEREELEEQALRDNYSAGGDEYDGGQEEEYTKLNTADDDQNIDQNEIQKYIRENKLEIADITFAKRTCEDIKALNVDVLPVWKKLKKANKPFEYKRFKKFIVQKEIEIQNFAVSEMTKGMKKYFDFQKSLAIDKKEFKTPPYAYVVFKSIAAKDLIENYYKVTTMQKILKRVNEIKKMLKRDKSVIQDTIDDKMKKMKVINGLNQHDDCEDLTLTNHKHRIKVNDPGTPDDINWLNMRFEKNELLIRQGITRLAGFVLILLTFFSILWFNSIINSPLNIQVPEQKFAQCGGLFKEEIKNQTSVQEIIKNNQRVDIEDLTKILKKRTYFEFKNKTKQANQWRDCYCNMNWISSKNEIRKINFADVGGGKKENLCTAFINAYDNRGPITLYASVFVTFLDGNIKKVLLIIQKTVEKNHNQSEDMIWIFQQRLILSYINLVIIMLIQNMYLETVNNVIPFIFNGDYPDFSRDWYFKLGAGLCVTQYTYMIKMHTGNFKKFAQAIAMRLWDRGLHIRIFKNTANYRREQLLKQQIEQKLTEKIQNMMKKGKKEETPAEEVEMTKQVALNETQLPETNRKNSKSSQSDDELKKEQVAGKEKEQLEGGETEPDQAPQKQRLDTNPRERTLTLPGSVLRPRDNRRETERSQSIRGISERQRILSEESFKSKISKRESRKSKTQPFIPMDQVVVKEDDRITRLNEEFKGSEISERQIPPCRKQVNDSGATSDKIAYSKMQKLSQNDILKMFEKIDKPMGLKGWINYFINKFFWIEKIPQVKLLFGSPKKDPEFIKFRDDNNIHTQKNTVDELFELYLGPHIASSNLYSDICLFWLICMTFSSGMPILYPICYMFNFMMFWAQKWLILKYYKKATNFNQKLAVKAIQTMRLGFYMHIFMGALMLSNERIFGTQENYRESSLYWAPQIVENSIEALSGRFVTEHSMGFVTVCFIWLIGYTTATLLGFLGQFCWNVYQEDKESVGQTVVGTNTYLDGNFYMDLTVDQLMKFNARIKKEKLFYDKWIKLFKPPTDPDQEDEKDEESHQYNDFIQQQYGEWHVQRIKEVQVAIKSHFITLDKFLAQKKSVMFQQIISRLRSVTSAMKEDQEQELRDMLKKTFLMNQKTIEVRFLIDVFKYKKPAKGGPVGDPNDKLQKYPYKGELYKGSEKELHQLYVDRMKDKGIHTNDDDLKNAPPSRFLAQGEDQDIEDWIDEQIDKFEFSKDTNKMLESFKKLLSYSEAQIVQLIINDNDNNKYNTDRWLAFLMKITDDIAQGLQLVVKTETAFRLMDVTQSWHMMDSSTLKATEKVRLDMLNWHKKLYKNKFLISSNWKFYNKYINLDIKQKEEKSIIPCLNKKKDKKGESESEEEEEDDVIYEQSVVV